MLSRPNIVMNHGSPAAGSAPAAGDRRREAQRREIDEAAPVRRLQVRPSRTRRAARRRASGRGSAASADAPRSGSIALHRRLPGAELRGDDVDVASSTRRAAGSGRVNVRPSSSHARGRRRGDLGRARERAAVVAERRACRSARFARVRALLLERVLDLEEVGEVAAGVEAHVEVHGLVRVVQDRQLLVEARRHRALPDHRELRVDVDGSGPGDEEEARLEVLEVVDRERVRAARRSTVRTQRERKRVSKEKRPGRIGAATPRCRRASSLTTNVLPSRILTSPSFMPSRPRRARRLPGNSRCMRTSSRQSPSTREVAAQHRRDRVQLPCGDPVEERPCRRG